MNFLGRAGLALVLCLLLPGAAAAASQPEQETAPTWDYGIGVVVVGGDGRFVVEETIPGSPSERVGLRKGDVILEIDGRKARTLTFPEGIAALRGSDRGPVLLLIRREGVRSGLTVPRELVSEIYARVGQKIEQGHIIPKDSDLEVEGDEVVPRVESAAPELGKPAPPLQGTDALTGRVVDLRDYQGRHLLVTFWASWCGFCRQQVPILQEALRRYGGGEQGRSPHVTDPGRLAIVGVGLDDEREDFDLFLRLHPFGTVQLFDGGWFGANSRAWHAYRRGVPSSFLIAPDGTILAWDLQGKQLLATLRSSLGPPRKEVRRPEVPGAVSP